MMSSAHHYSTIPRAAATITLLSRPIAHDTRLRLLAVLINLCSRPRLTNSLTFTRVSGRAEHNTNTR